MPLIQNTVTTPDNIVLDATIGATVCSNNPDAVNFDHTRQLAEGGWIGIGKNGTKFENLFHIASPEVNFYARVRPSVAPAVGHEWQVGFTQSIYALTRSATYTGNVNRRMRQNPARLPIRDGDDNCLLWYSWNAEEMKTLGATNVLVRVDDAPNQDFPLLYTGNLADTTKTVGAHQLNGTAGSDHFKTFAVAVQESTKSIVVLGAFEWFVHWAGTFNSATRIWTPTAPRMLPLNILPALPNPVFPNLGAHPVPLPFNPDEGCAFQNFQVEDAHGAWHTCGNKGDIKPKAVGTDVWANTLQDLT